MVLLGDTTRIRLTLFPVCAAETVPLHIVLVLDASGSMDGEPSRQLKEAGRRLIDRLDLPGHPDTRIGVVAFDERASALCQVTNQPSLAKSCVDRVGAQGGTCIDCGILEGLKVLVTGRRHLEDGEPATEVMVVLSDGFNGDGCTPVLAAARQARNQGVIVATVCLGLECDTTCLRSAASAGRYAFQARDAGELAGIFERIRMTVARIELKSLRVVDTLPPDIAYVPGSAEPEAELSPDGRQLTWATADVPREGITLTFEVRPAAVGMQPTNASAVAQYEDVLGRPGSATFPVPWISVLRAIPQPTETPPGTPATSTPSRTATPSPTARPTPTVDLRRWIVYVPLASVDWTPESTP